MSRLIDAEIAYDKIAEQETSYYMDMEGVQAGLDETPTVDAVEVVRCGEFKYFVQKQDNIGECSALLSGKFTGRYWYCADGERRTNGDC